MQSFWEQIFHSHSYRLRSGIIDHGKSKAYVIARSSDRVLESGPSVQIALPGCMERKTNISKVISRSAGPRSRRPDLPQRHSVSIIGAGRLGTALGLALKEKGHEIKVVVTRRPSTARRAARVFGPSTLALSAIQLSELSASQLDRLNRCSLILIATPDDSIPPTAELFAALFKTSPARRIALHTSGTLSSDALNPLRSAGFAAGSLHPLVSISDSRSGAEALTRAFFSVEGDPAAVRTAKSLVSNLGGKPSRSTLAGKLCITRPR